MRTMRGSHGSSSLTASTRRCKWSASVMPHPTRTLGRNSWIGALAGSSGAAGLLSTRHRRMTSGPSSLMTGGGTSPRVSMVSGFARGVSFHLGSRRFVGFDDPGRVDAIRLELGHSLDEIDRVGELGRASAGEDGVGERVAKRELVAAGEARVGEAEPERRIARLLG